MSCDRQRQLLFRRSARLDRPRQSRSRDGPTSDTCNCRRHKRPDDPSQQIDRDRSPPSRRGLSNPPPGSHRACFYPFVLGDQLLYCDARAIHNLRVAKLLFKRACAAVRLRPRCLCRRIRRTNHNDAHRSIWPPINGRTSPTFLIARDHAQSNLN